MIDFDRVEGFLALSRLGSGWPGPAPSPDRFVSGGIPGGAPGVEPIGGTIVVADGLPYVGLEEGVLRALFPPRPAATYGSAPPWAR